MSNGVHDLLFNIAQTQRVITEPLHSHPNCCDRQVAVHWSEEATSDNNSTIIPVYHFLLVVQ